MIKVLGDAKNGRWIGDTPGLLSLFEDGKVLRYEIQTNVPEYAVEYSPRSKRDPMPWVQVGGLESRLRSGEIVAVDADVFAAWEAEQGMEAAVAETSAASRYVVHGFSANAHLRFDVRDTVTNMPVATFSSRYAAQDKADRLNVELTATETRVAQSAEESPTADPKCIHDNTPRPDVTGDPIAECAKRSNAEWGAFSDEGCYYAYDCAVDVANESAKQNEEDGADADDPVSTWSEMCRDHRDQEQPKDGCEECNADQ